MAPHLSALQRVDVRMAITSFTVTEMREHQIVINLKPEQFDEVQRMARAAGSKSVGLFVRQKLLSTLGLSGPHKSSPSEILDTPDLKQLTSELRRLHRELQIFVADSLTNSDYSVPTLVEPSIPFPTAVQENFLADGAPLMPESMVENYGGSAGIQPPYALPDNLSALNTSLPSHDVEPPYSIPEAPPDELQSFTERDELEELAERAFSISPRLGQLEEPRKPFPDPLQDLLEEALLGGGEDEEEGSAPNQDQGVTPDEPTETDEAFESNEDEQLLEPDAQEFESEELEPETGSSSDEDDQSPPDPPPIPPPFSGGPPPRKRSK